MSFQNAINIQMLSEHARVQMSYFIHAITFPALLCAGPAPRGAPGYREGVLSEPGLAGQTDSRQNKCTTDSRQNKCTTRQAVGVGAGVSVRPPNPVPGTPVPPHSWERAQVPDCILKLLCVGGRAQPDAEVLSC